MADSSNPPTADLFGTNGGVTALLTHIPVGMILLDNQHRPLLVNDAARAMEKSYDLLHITQDGVFLHHTSLQKKFRRLIEAAAKAPPTAAFNPVGVVPLYRDTDEKSAYMIISPWPDAGERKRRRMDEIASVIYLSLADYRVRVPEQALRMMYGLTPAEASLVECLTSGCHVSTVADCHFRTKNTINSQLKSTFQKVGVNCQADLIRVILTGPVSLWSMPNRTPDCPSPPELR